MDFSLKYVKNILKRVYMTHSECFKIISAYVGLTDLPATIGSKKIDFIVDDKWELEIFSKNKYFCIYCKLGDKLTLKSQKTEQFLKFLLRLNFKRVRESDEVLSVDEKNEQLYLSKRLKIHSIFDGKSVISAFEDFLMNVEVFYNMFFSNNKNNEFDVKNSLDSSALI